MIAAVLCNGPSKKLYDESKEYDFRIGCNIPWTRVDATVILDEEITRYWSKHRDVITCPVYFSEDAWRFASEIQFRPWLVEHEYLLGLVKRGRFRSSGNIACECVIELGYKQIDIYGADAYYTQKPGYNNESFTRKFLPPPDVNNSHRWKKVWDDMIKKHPDVKFNFIKE